MNRKRALLLIGAAFALLVIVLVLLAHCQPVVGARYPWGARVPVYGALLGGWSCLTVGVFWLIAGPRGGTLARMLRRVALVAAVGLAVAGAIAAWAVHHTLSTPRSAASHHHHDLD